MKFETLLLVCTILMWVCTMYVLNIYKEQRDNIKEAKHNISLYQMCAKRGTIDECSDVLQDAVRILNK